MNRRMLGVVFAGLLAGSLLVPMAKADQDNQEILFSVNHPVEVPGRVLPAGRYEMKMDGDGSPIAGVWNATGAKFYGYFDTEPVIREHVTPHSKVVLENAGANNPKRIEEWFYPGDHTGHELMYNTNRNVEVANASSSVNRNKS